MTKITTLFLDIGGVLLTNGWGRDSRKAAAEKFKLDFAEMDERHHLTFDTYESGKLGLGSTSTAWSFMKPGRSRARTSKPSCSTSPNPIPKRST